MEQEMKNQVRYKVWIDLDNSPHIPFFKPIIRELAKKGIDVVLTIRENAQTVELADYHGLRYRKIGKHYGKNKIIKVIGTLYRAIQLLPYIAAKKPDLAVAHGSRAMLILAKILRIPMLIIGDYEHSKGVFHTHWILVPEVIPKETFHNMPPERVFSYPGIKEDVYVPSFNPDPKILDDFKVPEGKIIVTVRPPAVEAHYHNPESEKLFEAVIELFAGKENIVMIMLPRYAKQVSEIKARYAALVEKKSMIIPEKVYDGLNIIWFSDFVVSGGGTMNREAAALGVTVYSIFRGKIGAVDHYLSKTGRLVLLESVEDVKNKIKVEKRNRPEHPGKADNKTLDSVVGTICGLLKKHG
jgi:predicted glycosyltransferase